MGERHTQWDSSDCNNSTQKRKHEWHVCTKKLKCLSSKEIYKQQMIWRSMLMDYASKTEDMSKELTGKTNETGQVLNVYIHQSYTCRRVFQVRLMTYYYPDFDLRDKWLNWYNSESQGHMKWELSFNYRLFFCIFHMGQILLSYQVKQGMTWYECIEEV